MQKLESKKKTKNNGFIIEILPGQSWKYEQLHQPLYGTIGRGIGFDLIETSHKGEVFPSMEWGLTR